MVNNRMSPNVDLDVLLRTTQHPVETVQEVREWFRQLDEKKITGTKDSKPRRFVFRGQSSSQWPVVSTLYRYLADRNLKTDERSLCAMEKAIMIVVQRRGLTYLNGARLSYLYQLAHLQHYGAPTRLLDVTFDPNAALWFASQENGKRGRLVAFCVETENGNRLLNEHDTTTSDNQGITRESADLVEAPWKSPPDDWKESWLCWQPAQFDRRMFAQHGAFLIGGCPPSIPIDIGNRTSRVKRAASVYTEWHNSMPERWSTPGKKAKFPVFSITFPDKIKEDLRDILLGLYGINHARLYPDFSGVANYLTPSLLRGPNSELDFARAMPNEVRHLYQTFLLKKRQKRDDPKESPRDVVFT